MSRKFKRNLSSSPRFYDPNSFSSINSQSTLRGDNNATATNNDDDEKKSSASTTETLQEGQQQFSNTTAFDINLGDNITTPPPLITTTPTEPPLPFKPSLWRVPTSIHVRSVVGSPDLERGGSTRSNYFTSRHKGEEPFSGKGPVAAVYHSDLTRESSIATAISMRRADIIVSRDNPQHLHANRLSSARTATDGDEKEDAETSNIVTVSEEDSGRMNIAGGGEEEEQEKDDELLFEKKKSVIILLGRLLLKCGCPCHRVDDTLQHTSKLLMVDAAFSFLPDSVLITFININDTQSIMVKSPQGYDHGKIVSISDIMNHFHRGEIDLDQCLVLLHEVATAPPTCGLWSTLVFFTASSFTASAMMFGGTWIDASISGALGLLVAILYLLSARFPIYARVFEISASVAVAMITRALHTYCCFTGVAMSAILILLPGYTMTVGVIELSARHVTTGIVRLVYAVFYAFQLAYGLQVGSSMYNAIDSISPEDGICGQNLVSPWFYIPLLPVLSISIALSYGSSRKQWISQTISATIAFCLTYFLGKVIPDGQIVGAIAAFAVGLYSNFALKVTGEPPLGPLCVGVTLLVPGSIGVRGAYSALHNIDSDLSMQNFPMQMLTIALGLSAGLFAAAMIVYPAGKKRSMYISL